MPSTPRRPQVRRPFGAPGSLGAHGAPGSGAPPGARPLAGHTVLVTRARHQAEELGNLLEAEGARVIYFPTIRILPAADEGPLRKAAARASGASPAGRGAGGAAYDWIVFTSANAVRPFAEALTGPLPEATRVLAVGPATARQLVSCGLVPDLIPEAHVGEGVLQALEADAGEAGLEGTRVLLPRAATARAFLPNRLRELGAVVEVVEAYRNVPERRGGEKMRRLLRSGEFSILTFTSSSTVLSFFELVLEPEIAHPGALGGAVVGAIGPVTADTARGMGLPVEIVADPHTAPALARACAEWATAR